MITKTIVKDMNLSRPNLKTPKEIETFSESKVRLKSFQRTVDTFMAHDNKYGDLHADEGTVILHGKSIDSIAHSNISATGSGRVDETKKETAVDMYFRGYNEQTDYDFQARRDGDVLTYTSHSVRESIWGDHAATETMVHDLAKNTISHYIMTEQ